LLIIQKKIAKNGPRQQAEFAWFPVFFYDFRAFSCNLLFCSSQCVGEA
jgi:hypothetical protein